MIRLVTLALVSSLSLANAQSDIAELLGQTELTANEVQVSAEDIRLLAGESISNPTTAWLLAAPLRSGEFSAMLAERLQRTASDAPDQVLAELARLSGTQLNRSLLQDRLSELTREAAAEDALSSVLSRLGARLMRDELEQLPASVKKAATLILLAIEEAQPWQQKLSESAGDLRTWRLVEAYLKTPLPEVSRVNGVPKPDAEQAATFKQVARSIDMSAASHAAQDLILAVSIARAWLLEDESLIDQNFEVRMRSQKGAIILAGNGDHLHPNNGPILLIIDTAGADEYAQAGANHDRKHGISIALDLAGNDTYRADPQQMSAFGAGVAGIGLLWDEAGDDVYEAARRTQGAGTFGIGVLIDGGGDDLYQATADAQAHANAGIGLLIDRGGVDYYESFVHSQGFGGPRGAAALIDLHGNDTYIANDSDIRFPAPQDPQHNASLSQGAGVGERGDINDGQSLAGGVGILLDTRGDDAYTCGVFGQGAGYWQGAGLLIDLGGADKYRGHWYVQAAAANFAVGILSDHEGDDEYSVSAQNALGSGFDLSVGYFEDLAGSDTYRVGLNSLGSASAAGVGIFIDHAGNDDYKGGIERTFGWSQPVDGYRGLFPAFGLFFDIAGQDTYAGRVGPADGYLWTDPHTTAGGTQRRRGYGFDAE